MNILRSIMLIAVAVISVISPAHATTIPSWLGPSAQPEAGVAEKSVWLVVSASDKPDRPLDRLEILPAPVFSGSRSGMLWDLQLDYVKDRESFSFGRDQIRFIRFYTSVHYSLSGPPTFYQFKPMIRLRNGDNLEEEPNGVQPPGALKPGSYRYDKTVTVEYYGQKRERSEEASLSRPVLALAWTRADAEAARDEILVRYAGNEANRTTIPWNEEQKLNTPQGPVRVKARVNYQVKTSGGYSSWCETTNGTATLEIDGREQSFDYSHHCCDTIHVGGNPNYHCPNSGPRIDKWTSDSTKVFDKIHFDSGGAVVWYGTGVKPERAEQVDPSTVNVGFHLEQ